MTAESTAENAAGSTAGSAAGSTAGSAGREIGDQRVESRAGHLLPEEAAAGSDDPRAQAAAILAESDLREADQGAAPDTVLERRTSSETVDPQEPPD